MQSFAKLPDAQLDGSLLLQEQSASPSDADGQVVPDGYMAAPAGVAAASSDESDSGVDSDSGSGVVGHRGLAQAANSKWSGSGDLPGE